MSVKARCLGRLSMVIVSGQELIGFALQIRR